VKYLALIAIGQNGLSLQYASKGIKSDKEIVLKAI
jgi:hypothetical protein